MPTHPARRSVAVSSTPRSNTDPPSAQADVFAPSQAATCAGVEASPPPRRSMMTWSQPARWEAASATSSEEAGSRRLRSGPQSRDARVSAQVRQNRSVLGFMCGPAATRAREPSTLRSPSSNGIYRARLGVEESPPAASARSWLPLLQGAPWAVVPGLVRDGFSLCDRGPRDVMRRCRWKRENTSRRRCASAAASR